MTAGLIGRLFSVALLLGSLSFAQDRVALSLRDGRVLFGDQSVELESGGVELRTRFGSLRVPAEALLGEGSTATGSREAEEGPRPRETRTGRWFRVESDLSEDHQKVAAEELELFFERMVEVYDLDIARLRPPYGAYLYRRRADFKRVQDEIASGIEEQKGKGFAEGVAGFYSRARRELHLHYDPERPRSLEVARHEAAHLMNHLLSEQAASELPPWFDEGCATYFSMAIPGGAARGEPEDHPASLAFVNGELRAKRAYTQRAIRGVSYGAFLSREYAWGWGLVRFLRQHRGGKLWTPLLRSLRSAASEKRFLKATGFRSAEAFDKAWHKSLEKAAKKGRVPLGATPESLAAVRALKKPKPKEARSLFRSGASLARVGQSAAARVYLEAARRGGIADAALESLLAEAIVGEAELEEDAIWPAEALEALGRAVEFSPLVASYRRRLGEQLLVAAEFDEARNQLGLALLLGDPRDDEAAPSALRAEASLASEERVVDVESLGAARKSLLAALPGRGPLLSDALLRVLQEEEAWDALLGLLRERRQAGPLRFEEGRLLAGLLRLVDEAEDAELLYAELLRRRPNALNLWPERLENLAALGDESLERRRAEALKALAADARDLAWLRERVESAGR